MTMDMAVGTHYTDPKICKFFVAKKLRKEKQLVKYYNDNP